MMLEAAVMLQVSRPERFFAQLDSFDEVIDLFALRSLRAEEEREAWERIRAGDKSAPGAPEAYT